jgi:hypothetical protein
MPARKYARDPKFAPAMGNEMARDGTRLALFIDGANAGPVAELVGIEVGVVSGVMNLESSGVEASDWRPRHEEIYHDA